MASAGRAPRFGLWRVAYSAAALLACRAPGARAQDSDGTCSEITVSGLSEEDGFPPDGELYTNDLEADFYGKYVSEDNSSFVWYSVVDPTDHTSDIGDAAIAACTGGWVISSYPVGENFTDNVWYQASPDAGCEESPAALLPSEWIKMERDATSSSSTTSMESDIQVSCFVEEEDDGGSDEDDGGSDGLSNKTVIVLLIVIGVGFMVLMCLGALACCIKGKNSNEEGFMPPGELGEGSAIGGKAGDATKPGLHAHPEIQGAQHPRPEDWAPAYNSGSSAIPTGSRSGPSVRSIGYS